MSAKPYEKPRGNSNTVMFTSLSLILLAFFILLYALSSPKPKQKQLELVFEIKKAFQSIGGLFQDVGEAVEVGRGRQEQTLEVSSQVESLLAELNNFVAENDDLENFSYEVSQEKFLIRVPTEFTFPPGSVQVSPKAFAFLNKVFEVIARTENKVRVEGHTDDLPSTNPLFASNWELSAARATQILRFFVDKKIVLRHRFSAVGYGSYRPIASNRFSAGRAKNRRTTIVFLGEFQLLGGELGTGN